MVLSDAQKRAKEKYRLKVKNNYKKYGIEVNRDTESDLIEIMEAQKNKAEFMKEAIREKAKKF